MSKRHPLKAVFVGGGSFRNLPIVRAAMAERGVLDGGDIELVDLNLARAETVGRLIMRAPEWRRAGCRVAWTDKLDRALDGADVVCISMAVGSWEMNALSDRASNQRGFHGGDQLSVSGAFRSLTGGRVVLNVARRMEKHCPRAWLVSFANPVAVYSGMVNNHTRIRALGVCGGFSNHRWDLSRLMGHDEYRDEYDVVSAGVNHLSILLRGTHHGKDLYRELGEYLKPGWRPPALKGSAIAVRHLKMALRNMCDLYHRCGHILYSLEGDGLVHLFSDEMKPLMLRDARPLSPARIRAGGRKAREDRVRWDREFRAFLDQPLDDAFWAGQGAKHPWFAPVYGDATVAILRALSGVSRETLAASHSNNGAVRGFKDRTVLEYTVTLDRQGLTPATDMEVPDYFQGLITALATHQTLLGDALAMRDPRLFAEALFTYPLHQSTHLARALFRELLVIHENEIDPVFQKTRDYL